MTIYEINAWTWLAGLEARYGRPVRLSSVPAPEWDWLGGLGVDALWLMGVWRGSPEGVRDYTADARMGGTAGLLEARFELARRGLRLILDFSPNYAARDHEWVTESPDYFIPGSEEDLRREPESYCAGGAGIFARGRGSKCPAGTDVVQLNAFSAGWRRAAAATLNQLAGLCDGVRCDQATLSLNDVFAQTWGMRAGPAPASEFWEEVIGAVRERHGGFLFVTEAYGDREWDLQQLGFDYCYDRRLYDRLLHSSAEDVRGHLRAELAYQNRLLRFIENSDDPRAATMFAPEQHQAAAVVALTLPGAALVQERQMRGAGVTLPAPLERYYRHLLALRRSDAVRRGAWRLADASDGRLLAWEWQSAQARLRVVVNWSPDRVLGRACFPEGVALDMPAWGYSLDQA